MKRSPSRPRSVSAVAEAERSAPTRGRPRLITNERLLNVAREVFLERGIQATTGEVAERAGVSEGTLFHRFSSKEQLFRSAMRFDPDAAPAFIETLTTQSAEGVDLRSRLRMLAERLLELGRIAVPVTMMAWSNPSGEYRLEKMLDRAEGHRRAFGALRAFFEREIRKAGSGSRSDPEVLTRILMGSLHHYCLTSLLGVNAQGDFATPQFVAGLVEVLANSIEAPSARERRPRKSALKKPTGTRGQQHTRRTRPIR